MREMRLIDIFDNFERHRWNGQKLALKIVGQRLEGVAVVTVFEALLPLVW